MMLRGSFVPCVAFSKMAWLDNYDNYLPGGRSGFNTPASSARNSFAPHPMVADAWKSLRKSLVHFRGATVGTVAAVDHQAEEVLKYDQVFVRDFVPSALAFLMNGEPEIVKNFLLKTLHLQGWEKRVDRFKLGEGVMPASFKVLHDAVRKTYTLIADFGESAIGRVVPVDSGFWWIILLRAYKKSTGDLTLSESDSCQKEMKLILTLCLSEGFDTFPSLLCTDGCCMIDRRMGVYGYPIEIQALFFMALRSALSMLKQDTADGKECVERVVKRLHALSFHMRSYFWLDFQQLNDIYRYKTEEYSHTAEDKYWKQRSKIFWLKATPSNSYVAIITPWRKIKLFYAALLANENKTFIMKRNFVNSGFFRKYWPLLGRYTFEKHVHGLESNDAYKQVPASRSIK